MYLGTKRVACDDAHFIVGTSYGTDIRYAQSLHRPNYRQVGGLGSPANLHAYFNGPSGNKPCK